MATVLQEGQALKRLIHVYGVEGQIEVSLSEDGLAFRIPGTRKSVSMTWPEAVKAAKAEADTPAWLANDPLKFLQTEVEKLRKRAVKRAEKAKNES